MNAREEVLARIRTALRDRPAAPVVVRDYRTADEVDVRAPQALIDLLAERLTDYRATVRRCPPDAISTAVATALSERGARRVVVPDGLPATWLAAAEAVEFVADDPPLTPAGLDKLDGTITSCAVAIAETGTIVLDGGDGQGRRALTLVPDYHLVVVPSEHVVPSVPAAIARLDATRPLTWISGPSATSDIELQRIEGVHGPRTLEAILVDAEDNAWPSGGRPSGVRMSGRRT
ncbi:MAG TPA: LUD domain-containing protein [Jiangellaceae bacterium]|nr:LUD domain-containing protein [Jiangellaceae bacterium]